MIELDDAMEEQIAYLVLEEHRPFSCLDFLLFEIEGKEYGMKHNTFRNKFLLKREEKLNFHITLDLLSIPGWSHVVTNNTTEADRKYNKDTIFEIKSQ